MIVITDSCYPEWNSRHSSMKKKTHTFVWEIRYVSKWKVPHGVENFFKLHCTSRSAFLVKIRRMTRRACTHYRCQTQTACGLTSLYKQVWCALIILQNMKLWTLLLEHIGWLLSNWYPLLLFLSVHMDLIYRKDNYDLLDVIVMLQYLFIDKLNFLFNCALVAGYESLVSKIAHYLHKKK